MQHVNSVFFDTAPLIYLIENDERFAEKTLNFIVSQVESGALFYSSVLTYAEFCVKPEQLGKLEIITSFDDLIHDLDIDMVEINKDIARLTAKLRAKYTFLKTIDALQISSAIFYKCDLFFSNDSKLKNVNEINVVLVSEL